MSNSIKRSAEAPTPTRPSKNVDTRGTPDYRKDTMSKKLFEKEEKPNHSQADDFIRAIWPLLEKKLDNWMVERVDSLVSMAVDRCVASPDFQTTLAEKIQSGAFKKFDEDFYKVHRKIEKNEARDDDLEQYTRRNSIRISGVNQAERHEDTDEVVIEVLKRELGVIINKKDLDRSHRVGKPADGKPRQIIAKFLSHNTKVNVLKQKKSLREKKSSIRVTEDLTKGRLEAIKRLNTENKGEFKKLWTIDGAIFVKLFDDSIIVLRSLGGLEDFAKEIYLKS